jgi:hypothetical protein
MRIRILRDRYFTPANTSPRLSIRYPAGLETTVKREWGEVLVASGDAEEITGHHRPEATGED